MRSKNMFNLHIIGSDAIKFREEKKIIKIADSGAQVNVLPKHVYMKFDNNQKIENIKTYLSYYNGISLSVKKM